MNDSEVLDLYIRMLRLAGHTEAQLTVVKARRDEAWAAEEAKNAEIRSRRDRSQG